MMMMMMMMMIWLLMVDMVGVRGQVSVVEEWCLGS